MSFLYLFFSVVVCLVVVYGGRVDVGDLGSEGASSSSLLVLKPKLFSLTMLLLGLTIGSTSVEESLNVMALELSAFIMSSDVSELFTLVKVEAAVGVDIVVVTGEILTFAVEALPVRTLLSGFSVDLIAKVAMEVFADMPMDKFDGICVLLMKLSDELMLIVGTLLVVRFLIKVDCCDDV